LKPENRYIGNVHKRLPNTYHLKNNNPYASGVADVWYSGSAGDLWIEYKWRPTAPVRGVVKPDLTPQQLRWVLERVAEGRDVVVIVGCPKGGVVLYPGEVTLGVPARVFLSRLMNYDQVAEWIFSKVGASPCLSPTSCPP
jgi:hypothetical protein